MADAIISQLRLPGAPLAGPLTKCGPDINRLSDGDVAPLHVAVWYNAVGAVLQLLQAGANPNLQDGESGWSALHRALYFGHLQAAALLLQAGASLELVDAQGRTPLDLLARQMRRPPHSAGDAGVQPCPRVPCTEHSTVLAWGNGANFQLGTGVADLHPTPVRVDSLSQGATSSGGGSHVTGGADNGVVQLAAAKFHSAALTADGRVFTWGWGRGGRTGHGDPHIHSGQAAQILPRPVAGLGRRCVVSVAVGKHHTLVATSAGELWSWGSNKDGRLGYGGADTEPVPRKVTLPRLRVAAVAAANKHSAFLTSGGDVYTFGANDRGQLGYGTVDSGCNPTPRLVDALKGTSLVAVSVAKHHTVVLAADGCVWQWGHKAVTPRLVQLAGSRDTRCAGAGGSSCAELQFHRGRSDVARPFAVAVAAGAAATSCLTRTGVVLTWRSDQPVAQEVGGPLVGKRVVAISASKARTCCTTEHGEVFVWQWPDISADVAGRSRGSDSRRGGGADAPTASSLPGALDAPAGAAAAATGGQPSQVQPPPAQPLSLQGDAAVGDAAARGWAEPGADGVPVRVPGIVRAVHVAVGDKHTLVLQRWTAPLLPADAAAHATMLADALPVGSGAAQAAKRDSDASTGNSSAEDGDAAYTAAADASEAGDAPFGVGAAWMGTAAASAAAGDVSPPDGSLRVESLHLVCQRAVARSLVEPRTVLPLLEYADLAGAQLLRSFCLSMALRNLDMVLQEARTCYEGLAAHLLAELEGLCHTAWLGRLPLGPAPQRRKHDAAPPAVGGAGRSVGSSTVASDAAGMPPHEPPHSAAGAHLQLGLRPTAAALCVPLALSSGARHGVGLAHAAEAALGAIGHAPSPAVAAAALVGRFTNRGALAVAADQEAVAKLRRNCLKKLQQVEALEEREEAGHALDAQQTAKMRQKASLQEALQMLATGQPLARVQSLLAQAQAAATKLYGPEPTPTSSGGGSAALGSSPCGASPHSAPGTHMATHVTRHLQARAEGAQAGSGAGRGGHRARAGDATQDGSAAPAPSAPAATAGEGAALAAAAQPVRRPAARKGGLSQFLAGRLDQPAGPAPHAAPHGAAAAASPPAGATSVARGPAWGGAGLAAHMTTAERPSLRNILHVERHAAGAPCAGPPGSSPPVAGRAVAVTGTSRMLACPSPAPPASRGASASGAAHAAPSSAARPATASAPRSEHLPPCKPRPGPPAAAGAVLAPLAAAHGPTSAAASGTGKALAASPSSASAPAAPGSRPRASSPPAPAPPLGASPSTVSLADLMAAKRPGPAASRPSNAAPAAAPPLSASAAPSATPAWRSTSPGASPPAPATGPRLKDIQQEQEKQRVSRLPPSLCGAPRDAPAAGASEWWLGNACSPAGADAAARSPPRTALARTPSAGADRAPSATIQLLIAGGGLSRTPAAMVAGGSALLGTSPASFRAASAPLLGSSPPVPQSKWYVQEQPQVVPLTAIQTEEAARKELEARDAARRQEEALALELESLFDGAAAAAAVAEGADAAARHSRRRRGAAGSGSAPTGGGSASRQRHGGASSEAVRRSSGRMGGTGGEALGTPPSTCTSQGKATSTHRAAIDGGGNQPKDAARPRRRRTPRVADGDAGTTGTGGEALCHADNAVSTPAAESAPRGAATATHPVEPSTAA